MASADESVKKAFPKDAAFSQGQTGEVFHCEHREGEPRAGPRSPLRECLLTVAVFALFVLLVLFYVDFSKGLMKVGVLLKNLPSLRPNHVNRPATGRRPRIT